VQRNEAQMSDDRPEHYANAAQGCLEIAEQTKDRDVRASFLALAEKWLRLALARVHRSSQLDQVLAEFNERQLKQ